MSKRLLVLMAPLLAAGCVTDRDTDTLSDSAAKGRAFAQENCAGCHGMDNNPSPNPNAPTLYRAARQLPDWMVAGSFERGVQVGHTTEMPVFVFEDDDIENLLAYFDALKSEG